MYNVLLRVPAWRYSYTNASLTLTRVARSAGHKLANVESTITINNQATTHRVTVVNGNVHRLVHQVAKELSAWVANDFEPPGECGQELLPQHPFKAREAVDKRRD